MPAIASTKDKILETALNLFYRRGIRATGVDLIISEASVHKSTFFKHFPTKADVVAAYLRLRDERWLNWFIRSVELKSKKPEDQLLGIFDALTEWYEQPDFRGCAFINTIAETADETTIEYQLCIQHKKRLETFVAQLIKAAKLRNGKQLVEQTMILIEGTIIRTQMDKSSRSTATAKAVMKTLIACAK